jgi:protein phosphatase
MKRYFAGTTDKGCVRSVNQDSYYMDPDGRFFIVADGMGGHAGGQEASKIAIDAMTTYLNTHWQDSLPSPQLLEEAFFKANDAIMADQQSHQERSDMGTTAVVVLFRDEKEKVWCANMGDSRIYRLRGKNLKQITEDQTWVAQAVRQNALTPEQARIHPWRHVLSQCLGREDMGAVELVCVEVRPGDRLLLCSDGLTEELPDEEIAPLVADTDSDWQTMVRDLVEAAKEKGGRDNITVLVVALE